MSEFSHFYSLHRSQILGLPRESRAGLGHCVAPQSTWPQRSSSARYGVLLAHTAEAYSPLSMSLSLPGLIPEGSLSRAGHTSLTCVSFDSESWRSSDDLTFSVAQAVMVLPNRKGPGAEGLLQAPPRCRDKDKMGQLSVLPLIQSHHLSEGMLKTLEHCLSHIIFSWHRPWLMATVV